MIKSACLHHSKKHASNPVSQFIIKERYHNVFHFVAIVTAAFHLLHSPRRSQVTSS